ncbi:MAG TPA: DNA mismatch repair protein MutS [Dehalococcoidia bacterium]|nr:DNA mismatch repair protein MutS [Dehalococcoidia bacterium]
MAETPLRRQYLEIKRRYPHAIVFFRLGDFYETFDEDAATVARELQIVLTSRPVSKSERVPMAGIPHHALDSYLARLIRKGYRVAICEQMEPPGKERKLVQRQVVRVVTPGTVLQENLLDQRANNYLAAVIIDDSAAGLAYADVSTGEFACCQLDATELEAELARLDPAELLAPPSGGKSGGARVTISALPPDSGTTTLLAHFAVPALESLGLERQPLAARAASALLTYLKENQPAVLGHISGISAYTPGGAMALDAQTRRNLELLRPLREEGGASLLQTLDFTRTAMGARLLRRWLDRPLLDITEISRRQGRVAAFAGSAVLRGQAQSLLGEISDLERILSRTSAGSALPRELLALRRGLELAPRLRQALEVVPELAETATNLLPCEETVALIAGAIAEADGELICVGFSDELDRLRSLAQDSRQFLADLERRERERSGIKGLRVAYNRVFGYYIEVSKANQDAVPADYERRQTLASAQRFTTPELKEAEYQILHARERQEELERELFQQVCVQVAADSRRILQTAAAIAEIDVYCALGDAAARYDYVRPQVNNSQELFVRDGRHPVVERMLAEKGDAFVPNDVELDSGSAQIMLLTGPNMAGKSTYLRQVALIALMAQVGSFVPAAEARIGVVDRIFTRIGAVDDIAAGRSTFMVEMVETAAILHNATARSLLLFDEIGRGTSTYDGMAIARAVVEFLHNRPEVASRTLFATHYHELVELADHLPRLRNYNVAVAEEAGGIVFLHRILPGGADRSYGVHVAQLAGLPRPVVLRAQELLEQLEAAPRNGTSRPAAKVKAPQLSLFAGENGLLREIAELDIDSLTPLEAITRLYELRQKARNGGSPPEEG